MAVEVIMPKVDMDMTSGTVVKWHVKEGTAVGQGDALFDIETDKAAMEVEAPASGTLHHVVASEGAEVAIGETVAWIFADGEEVTPVPKAKINKGATPSPRGATPAPLPMGKPAPQIGEETRATPAARRAAREAGISLEGIKGRGPNGRIQSRDIPPPPRTPAEDAPSILNETGPLHISRSGPVEGLPLVLFHGFAADATSFASIEPALAAKRPVIRIDLPGHGKSPKRVPNDFPALLAELRSAFDTLGHEQVHLVGHSLGGALAIALADTRPRRVSRLTLLSPAGLGPEMNGPAIRGLARASRPESLGPWVRLLTADPDAISENFILAAAMFRADPALRAAQVAMADALFPDDVQSFDLTAALHRVTCPTRIVFGKRDKIIPYRHALRAPGRAALHLYEAVGHLPQFEISEEIAGLLLEDL